MQLDTPPAWPFLSNGNEMGRLTRQFDWTTTTLGSPDQWPQSLRITLSILLNARFPMFLWWGPDLMQFYNDAYRPSLGENGKHPTALGQKGVECWPEIWPTIKPLIDQVMAGGEATWNENQLVPIYRNGRLDDVYWTFGYSPVLDEAGEVGGVLVVCQETTAVVQKEEANQRLRGLFEQAPVAIATFRGPQFIINFANPTVCELWGRSMEQVLGKPLFEALPEAAGQGFEERLTGVLQTGEPFLGNELPSQIDRDGQRVTVYWNFVYEPLHEYGHITGITVVATDVSEQVAARRTVERSEQNLREADRRKEEFLAMLGHELRNPLAPLHHSLQLLRLTGGKDQTLTPTVDLMTRQVNYLVRMVDDLLDVSRINQGKVELRRERIELRELVAQAVKVVRPLYYDADERELNLTPPGREIAPNQDRPNAIHLNGDATRLTQAITNLLTNAAKYTQPGGHVRVSVERAGEEAVVRVADDGIGLEADQLVSIFEMFVQVNTGLDRPQGGLGLGLTVVKRLVELHGGRVAVQSAGLGQGSEFLVYLPAPAGTFESPQPPGAGTKQAATGRRVLVVDDNKDAATTLSMLLKLSGYEVHTRYGGREAIEAAGSLQPDVVLLDIGMPVLNGYDICRLIREQPWGQSMVLIALTGYGQEDDKRRSREAGFDAHLVKPVGLADLTQLLNTLPPGQTTD